MKAVRFHAHGGPELLKYEEIETPQAGAGEAVVEVKAISVNHLDIWLRKGLPGIKIPLPRIPGADASGIVKSVGSGVTHVKPGDHVLVNPNLCCGHCPFCTGGEGSLCPQYGIVGEHCDGTYCELLKISAKNLIPIPANISFEEAAAAPLVFLTAWSMLVTKAKVKPGEDVLILGAGAGVGTACIQIAKLCGARVWAAAGNDGKLEKARSIGADILINYTTDDFSKKVRELSAKRGVDIVVDYIGKETWNKSLLSLRRGGRLVTCGATTGYDPIEDLRQIFYRQISVLGSTMGSDRELHDVLRAIFQGKLKAVIDRTMPLSQAAEAHKLIESRVPFGKIILIP